LKEEEETVLNVKAKFDTEQVFQPARFWLKADPDALLNEEYSVVTLAVFQLPMGVLNADAEEKVYIREVTDATFHFERS
jgi:hypothetical protein